MNNLLKFFRYDHLPNHIQKRSKPFHDLAHEMADFLPKSEETDMAFRKLLESKDCAVRAYVEVLNSQG